MYLLVFVSSIALLSIMDILPKIRIFKNCRRKQAIFYDNQDEFKSEFIGREYNDESDESDESEERKQERKQEAIDRDEITREFYATQYVPNVDREYIGYHD
jgi:CRISPR/Cas system CSM-associated protein Csm3 (group 7 of RAMP superfamily)